MAPMKAMKRAASKSAGGARMAKKCKVIAPAIKTAESLPQPVRSIISDKLVHVFGTYKEERHAFQNTVSTLVGQTLKTRQNQLDAVVAEARAEGTRAEAEGATLTNASNDAQAASEAADKAAAGSKQQHGDANAALKAAKTAVHDLENEVTAAEVNASTTKGKKEKLESLIKEFFTAVKEGSLDKGLSKSASWAARQLGKEHAGDLEKEFIVCVERTFSKAASTWGTFDFIVDKELDASLKGIVRRLGTEIANMEAATGPRAARVEGAKATIIASEEKVKAAEEALNNATNTAKDAKKVANAAAAGVKQHAAKIAKATRSLEEAQHVLAAFIEGPVAAYTEVEAHTAPPPAPEQPAEVAAAAPLEQAMTAAPPAQQQRTPSVLPSPGVLFMQAAQGMAQRVGLSPRIAQSPR